MPPRGEDASWAVVFDLDGVLVDSYAPHCWSWQRLGDETGVHLTEDQFAGTFGKTSREVIQQFWGVPSDSDESRRLDDRKEALYRERLREAFPAVDGARELVDALHAAGAWLAVGSSAPPENVELSLQLLQRRACFTVVVTGRDVDCGKPDPAIYRLARERLGLRPGRCVVVEDAPVGVTAARRAEMPCVGLVGTVDAARLAEADLVVPSLRQLDPARLQALLR
jgi:beta-phosphoglucomutase